MSKRTTGLILIQLAAWAEIIGSILVDGFIYSSAHMQNPLWLPHAKLHCAMSFNASIALGVGALLVLWTKRRRLERSDLAIAAFLSCVFGACLLLARLWPGTSWTFAQDPAFVNLVAPRVLGVEVLPNVVLAVLLIIIAIVGYLLVAPSTVRAAAAQTPTIDVSGALDPSVSRSHT